MMTRMSRVIDVQRRSVPGFVAVDYVDLVALGVRGSPLAVLDHFRLASTPFSAHPHAGFAAVTYVFEDSPSAVRSRTSTGVDLTVGPGGIVWTAAGRGIIHEEIPADLGRELHGVQLFVNVSARHKLSEPRVMHLYGDAVPEWQEDRGSRVRVVVGSFGGVTSPLVPAEPFTLLDVTLRDRLAYRLSWDEHTVLYALAGSVTIHPVDSEPVLVRHGQVLALSGADSAVTLEGADDSHFLLLTGRRIHDPIVEEGPFMMNDRLQIEAAIARYHSGEMGGLSPSEGG